MNSNIDPNYNRCISDRYGNITILKGIENMNFEKFDTKSKWLSEHFIHLIVN